MPVDPSHSPDIVFTNQTLSDEKFRKAYALMVSTDMGLKATGELRSTEALKQDVYFVLVEDPSFFSGEANHASTVTFDMKAIRNGRYTGRFKDGDVMVRLRYSNTKIDMKLKEMDFSVTTKKDWKSGNVSVVFVNKSSNDKLSTINYSNTLYHELQAHIVRNISLPAVASERSAEKDHEEYHGISGHYSPSPGDERKGSIMNRYLDQASKSYFQSLNRYVGKSRLS